MPRRDLIVVGASAGGVEALRTVVGGLPDDLPAAVLVVLHVPADGGSALAAVLGRDTDLDVAPATDGEVLAPGTVRVAPPDRHLLVVEDAGRLWVHLAPGPRVNGHRPAVDPLFRSAAEVAGPRVLALVLSGSQDDGAAGLRRVRARHGLAVVQDPTDAAHPGMPRAALEVAGADHVAPARDLARLLASLAGHEVEVAAPPVTSPLARALADLGPAPADRADRTTPGTDCPDCGRPLTVDGDRHRCRAGHQWSTEALVTARSAAIESALWTALRSLEDKAALADRMTDAATGRGHPLSAGRFTAQAVDARQAAGVLRDLLEGAPHTGTGSDGHGGRSPGG